MREYLKTAKGATSSIGKISVFKHFFCYSNLPTTGNNDLFFSTANGVLVGTLMTMGDVNDIFRIALAVEADLGSHVRKRVTPR